MESEVSSKKDSLARFFPHHIEGTALVLYIVGAVVSAVLTAFAVLSLSKFLLKTIRH